jgi:DNA-binding PadR family transcriptional regulator
MTSNILSNMIDGSLAALVPSVLVVPLSSAPPRLPLVSLFRMDTMPRPDPEAFLPLTTPEYHVLLALGDAALHGYAMMQALEAKTGGKDTLLPGTLYTTLARMVRHGLLEELEEPPEPGADARRRYYRVTALGRAVGKAETARLARLIRLAEAEKLAPGVS